MAFVGNVSFFEYENDRSSHNQLDNMHHTGGLEMRGVWLKIIEHQNDRKG